MVRKRGSNVALACACAFAVSCVSSIAYGYEQSHGRPLYVSGEIIVKMKKSVKVEKIASLPAFKSLNLKALRNVQVSYGNYFVVGPTQKGLKKSYDETIKDLNQSSFVEFAEPNYLYYPTEMAPEDGAESYIPDDQFLGKLWGLQDSALFGADVQKAWGLELGDVAIKIAVIDTGIDYKHPDLKDQVYRNEAEFLGFPNIDDDSNGYIDDVYGYDFLHHDGDAMDDYGHGSHCAGTIGAAHGSGIGVPGIMSRVTLVPIKFLGTEGGSLEGAIEAIDYATKMNVDLMSNSWGGGGFSQALLESIERAAEAGIIFVAAAGNESANNDMTANYPSNYDAPNVIAVAAHTSAGKLASFSNYGKTTVDISAPGADIYSTVLNGKYDSYSGTSMATPHVSGVLGLLLSQEGRMDFAQLKERLFLTSVPLRSLKSKTVSGGILSAYNLLAGIYPERTPEPADSEFVPWALSEVFETNHPYAVNDKMIRTYKVEGARFIRVVINKMETEARYDEVSVIQGAEGGEVVEKLSGKYENKKTAYVEGDTVTIKFSSDRSVTEWGVLIDTLEVVK